MKNTLKFYVLLMISRYQCFKSAWVTTVLHDGLKFPKSYKGLTTVQMIDGKEVQWTLGALLYRTRFLPLKYDMCF